VSTAVAVRPAQSLPANTAQSLASLQAAWLLSYGSPRTRKAYGHDFSAFRAWLAPTDVPVLNVQRFHVDAYVQALEGLRPTTVARALASLSSFYDYALDLGLVPANPVARVRRPKTGERHVALTPALDLQGAQALLAVATAPQDRALILWLVMTCTRISELLALDLDCESRDRQHVTALITGKGQKSTRKALPPVLTDVLAQLSAERGTTTGPMFVSPATGERMSPAGAARALTRLGRRAGLIRKDGAGTWRGKVTPHMFKSTGITLALGEGCSLRDVQDWAQHSDPKTTARYDRDAGQLDRSPAYVIAGLLEGAQS
jgi:integrase/recombinase XerD